MGVSIDAFSVTCYLCISLSLSLYLSSSSYYLPKSTAVIQADGGGDGYGDMADEWADGWADGWGDGWAAV